MTSSSVGGEPCLVIGLAGDRMQRSAMLSGGFAAALAFGGGAEAAASFAAIMPPFYLVGPGRLRVKTTMSMTEQVFTLPQAARPHNNVDDSDLSTLFSH